MVCASPPAVREEVPAMAEDTGMTLGTPEIDSVGSITFGPDDVLFVADNMRATITALDVADDGPTAGDDAFEVDDLDTKLAAFLGCNVDDVVIRDLDVHPRTQNVYLSIMRGRGTAAIPLIVKIDRSDGSLSEVPIEDVAFSQVSLANAPNVDDERTDTQLPDPPDGDEIEVRGTKLRIARVPARVSTVTDMAYVNGMLLVAGMSNEEFSSNLRRIPFPFSGEMVDNSLEIFHVSHGMWETAAPIRTFVPYEDGRSILASYTCTPLVHFPLTEVVAGTHAVGRTVAELGPMNQPVDMVSFRQGTAEYLLIAHSRHPLMKIACTDIDVQDALTEPQEPRGVPRDEIEGLGKVRRLANLNDEHVLALQRDESGGRHLRSLKTASL
jgi:hypothetical protein